VSTGRDHPKKPVETVCDFIEALESHDIDRAAEYLADDFSFIGLTPFPMDKGMYIEFQRGIAAAFSDWSLNLTGIQEEGGVVRGTARTTATHTGDLVLPIPDLPVLPATGKIIKLPAETHLYSVRGGKISSIHVLVVPGGGLQGVYRQLGARVPLPSIIEG